MSLCDLSNIVADDGGRVIGVFLLKRIIWSGEGGVEEELEEVRDKRCG